MATLQIAGVGVDAATLNSTLQIGGMRVFGDKAVPSTSTLQVSRASLSGAIVNAAPIVSVSQTSFMLDAGADFTVTGFDTDTDGTIVGRSWRLGSTVVSTTSVLTYRAPCPVGDQVLTFVYTATDDKGLASSANVTVTVRRAPIILKNPDGSFTGYVLRTRA